MKEWWSGLEPTRRAFLAAVGLIAMGATVGGGMVSLLALPRNLAAMEAEVTALQIKDALQDRAIESNRENIRRFACRIAYEGNPAGVERCLFFDGAGPGS